MNSKVSKYLIRIVLILLGLSVIGVTLFLFLYVFWKGKTVMSLSFILDKPAGVPIGTSGGIFPALMGSLYLGALAALEESLESVLPHTLFFTIETNMCPAL